ncbi:hypothetical protein PM082_022008 [Marasmius tenuissimus]|nr:hypothetical protein PM082_022008 [Marasmius tenuissimus]
MPLRWFQCFLSGGSPTCGSEPALVNNYRCGRSAFEVIGRRMQYRSVSQTTTGAITRQLNVFTTREAPSLSYQYHHLYRNLALRFLLDHGTRFSSRSDSTFSPIGQRTGQQSDWCSSVAAFIPDTFILVIVPVNGVLSDR